MKTLPAIHFTDNALLDPTNPITVNLIGAGGTGHRMLTELVRMHISLQAFGKPGLQVNLFDDDIITEANRGRQMFAQTEIGHFKSVILINRINRFNGTNWKAVPEKYDKQYSGSGESTWATITIACVDTVQARQDIAHVLKTLHKAMTHNSSQPLYYMDFGNSKDTGQVILSTIGKISQPASKQYRTVEILPMVMDEFGELLSASETTDNTPSCSLAEALTKQDLFINSALANIGASLLWQLFREGILFNRGFFLNLKEFKTQPLKVA